MEWLIPILDAVVGSLVRSALLLLTGFLIEHHLVTKEIAERFVSDGVTHVLIALPAVLAVAWSIWVKVRGRKRFLTALQAAPGTSEQQVKDKVANGMGVSVTSGAILLACVLAAPLLGCASLPAKQRAVITLSASETSLEAAHSAERVLCSPTSDQSAAIRHCDGAAAIAMGLTDDVHRKAAAIFSRAFDAEVKAATALKAWRAGAPAPDTLAEYQRDLDELLTLIGQIIPSQEATATHVRQAIDRAAQVAAAVGSVR